jgi:hypothetical protein
MRAKSAENLSMSKLLRSLNQDPKRSETLETLLRNGNRPLVIVFRYLDELIEKQEHPNPPRKRIGYKPDDL